MSKKESTGGTMNITQVVVLVIFFSLAPQHTARPTAGATALRWKD